MKDIKFRIWSKRDKRWVTSMGLIACCDGLPFAHIVEVNEQTGEKIRDHVGYMGQLDPVVQQFTGLQDKNGEDIYEGDILQCSDVKTPPIIKNKDVILSDIEREVVFHNGAFKMKSGRRSQKFYLNALMIKANGLEVVGNTFER